MPINTAELIFVVTAIILILITAFVVNLSLSSHRLKKEHEFTSKILDTTSALILVLNKEGRILACNTAYSGLTGAKVGDSLEEIGETSTIMAEEDHLTQAETPAQFEKSLMGKDGQRRTISWSRGRIKHIYGGVQLILTGIDITERKRAYEKLRVHQTQLRALSSQLSLSEERERRRIAGELHDRIGQYLSMARMKLGELQKGELSVQMASIVRQIDELVSQTIKDTRNLIFEISPPILQELGFIAAIKWLAEKIGNEHKIAILVETELKEAPGIDENLRMILYRAVRELLFNIVKHSEAGSAKVSIGMKDRNITVNVADDGVGFDYPALDYGQDGKSNFAGFGLFNVRETVNHSNGHFAVESKRDCGTLVKISVPLPMGGGNRKPIST